MEILLIIKSIYRINIKEFILTIYFYIKRLLMFNKVIKIKKFPISLGVIKN